MVKKKSKRAVTDTQLLRLWAEVVRARVGYRCEFPGCKVVSKLTHPHHFFSRRIANLRYSPDNGLCLCANHHVFGNQSAHLDPFFKDIIICSGVRTVEWLNKLASKRMEIVKNNQIFKDRWFDILKGMI